MKTETLQRWIFFAFLLLGVGLWYTMPPQNLPLQAWRIFIVFTLTIGGIILNILPMGVLALSAATLLVLTHTLSLPEALSGFASPLSWLILSAFFIAKGVIQTQLGARIATFLMVKLGKTTKGLAYSLLFTEVILSPMIPSTSARGGGILYPISLALAREFEGASRATAKWFIVTSFHANVLCCTLFLTAMSANPLIASLSQSLGIRITWAQWALGALPPGLLNLLLLPHLTAFLVRPLAKTPPHVLKQAYQAHARRGSFSKAELYMALTFIFLITLWIAGPQFNLQATTAAFTGLIFLVVARVISWKDLMGEKTAWETFVWFSLLLMLSESLAKYGVSGWVEGNLKTIFSPLSPPLALGLLALAYFYSHYLFASITARVTVTYLTFLGVVIELGVSPIVAALGLGLLSILSASLTHYGINSAIIYFGAGYFKVSEWLKIGAIVASFNLVFWILVGGLWWHLLGWW